MNIPEWVRLSAPFQAVGVAALAASAACFHWQGYSDACFCSFVAGIAMAGIVCIHCICTTKEGK